MLKCGFFETDITNFIGNDVPGGFKRSKLRTLMDPLKAHAFALQASGEPVMILSLNAIAVEACDSTAIRKGISEATGVPFSNISVAADHIHTGGPVIDLYENPRDPVYCAFMVKRAIEAGIMAYNRMEDARIGFTSRPVEGLAFNRRFYMKNGSVVMNPGRQNPDIVKPADITDPEFFVVRVDRADGTPMGVLTSFALHLCCTGRSDICSADYPGQICRHLRAHYGEDLGYLSLTGCCGNINHIDFTKSAEEDARTHVEIGAALADAAIEMLEGLKTGDTDIVACTSSTVVGHMRRPTLEECMKGQNTSIMTEMFRTLKLPEEDVDIEVWTARIGNNAIQMLPGEVFARFGLDVKARSSCEHTIVAELCNANLGYIYTKEAEEQGGYEATPSTYIKMNSDTGYSLADAAAANLEKLCDETGEK